MPDQQTNDGVRKMAKVLILYDRSYGHTERMAQAVAEGVRETGAKPIKPVPELSPEGFRIQT